MRPHGRHLDDLVYPQKRPGLVRRTLFPWDVRYDPLAEAERLLKEDLPVQQTGISAADAAYFLADAYREHRLLYASSQAVDTADRFAKIISEAIQPALLPLAIPIETTELIIETAAKLPFFIALGWKQHTRHLVPWLFTKELATSAVPYFGDAYDIFTNAYINAAREAITEYGRDKILAAYEHPGSAA